MTIRRFIPIVTGSVAAVALATGAYPAETWRAAHKMPADSPDGLVFQRLADLVEMHSNGELTITVNAIEQLGKTETTMEQPKLDTVHLYAEGST